MRFLLDMCVDARLAEILRDQGHSAVHLSAEGLPKLADPEVFKKAASENRIVVTMDLDFGEIVAFAQAKAPSIIVFRTNNTRLRFIAERLSAVLTESAAALGEGAVVVVEDTRHRVRRLPIGFPGGS